jgi:hypothetical protein
MSLSKIIIISHVLLLFAGSAIADVIQGSANLGYSYGYGWDFSDSTNVQIDEADIFLMEVHDPNWGFMLIISSFTGSMFAESDSSFEELTTAPADAQRYTGIIEPCIPLYPSPCTYYTYVVKTPDRHYAKFRIINTYPCPGYCIEYVYQPDGTRNFLDQVPVEEFTWGEIKSIYKEAAKNTLRE